MKRLNSGYTGTFLSLLRHYYCVMAMSAQFRIPIRLKNLASTLQFAGDDWKDFIEFGKPGAKLAVSVYYNSGDSTSRQSSVNVLCQFARETNGRTQQYAISELLIIAQTLHAFYSPMAVDALIEAGMSRRVRFVLLNRKITRKDDKYAEFRRQALLKLRPSPHPRTGKKMQA